MRKQCEGRYEVELDDAWTSSVAGREDHLSRSQMSGKRRSRETTPREPLLEEDSRERVVGDGGSETERRGDECLGGVEERRGRRRRRGEVQRR